MPPSTFESRWPERSKLSAKKGRRRHFNFTRSSLKFRGFRPTQRRKRNRLSFGSAGAFHGRGRCGRRESGAARLLWTPRCLVCFPLRPGAATRLHSHQQPVLTSLNHSMLLYLLSNRVMHCFVGGRYVFVHTIVHTHTMLSPFIHSYTHILLHSNALLYI